MKETEDKTNRWKGITGSWIRRKNIIKMTILPKAIKRFNEISIRNINDIFTEPEQIILKSVWGVPIESD